MTNSDWSAHFDRWSRAAHGTAVARLSRGDVFGATLATARSEVYALAARSAKGLAPAALVDQCAEAEVAHHWWQGSPDAIPFGEVDGHAVEHARAMAWQLCARTVDPDHAAVEWPW